MYCNKQSVNILTAQLLAYGVEDAVVCPGSRNAVIVHNLNEYATSPSIPAPLRLHPVTDERCAAFVAIGLWLATRRPIAVCVTSGSALLNLLPGVAEAYYRHIPLIIISADRPPKWIGQLDGQTIPQTNALLPYAQTWNITEDDPVTAARLCRESLTTLQQNGGQIVHWNVPLTEPLFGFTTPQLPNAAPFSHDSSYIGSAEQHSSTGCRKVFLSKEVMQTIRQAQKPAIIIGQYESGRIEGLHILQENGWTIFAENISNQNIYNDTLTDIDLLIHIGGALVEKRLKLQLRQCPDLPIIRIDETDESPATFGHVTHKVKGNPAEAILQIAAELYATACPTSTETANHSEAPVHQHPVGPKDIAALFLGNSTAVRWANQHFRSTAPTYCNRGVNGIEGSLSVAAGYSLLASKNVLCIIGDLSFFYDCNALWNRQLRSNLRILLINNNRGGIFYRLPGLAESPALPDFIAAQHTNDARGIAESYKCTYITASSSDLGKDIHALIARLLNEPSEHPVILEVTTN